LLLLVIKPMLKIEKYLLDKLLITENTIYNTMIFQLKVIINMRNPFCGYLSHLLMI